MSTKPTMNAENVFCKTIQTFVALLAMTDIATR